MDFLDKKIIFNMKQEMEESVFVDEMGEIIDSMMDLETDKDIVDKYCCEKKELTQEDLDELDLLD